MRSRLSGSRRDESAQVGSQKRKSLVSGAVWYQTKHGNRKYDIEMRYCHFNSHTYSQIYDGRARARTADTHAHRTTRTKLNCKTQHEHTCCNSAKNRHQQQIQRTILRQGLSLAPHSSKDSPHASLEQPEDMPSMMPAASLQDKGTQTVSTCSCKHMGSASGRGSAHLRTKSSSSRRHLRRGGVQRGHRCPLCWLARRHRRGAKHT